MIDAAIDGIEDMVARILEEHFLEHLLGPGHGGDAKEATSGKATGVQHAS
jgi:hypothetical protein